MIYIIPSSLEINAIKFILCGIMNIINIKKLAFAACLLEKLGAYLLDVVMVIRLGVFLGFILIV